jgi:hypothetical protein
VARQGAEIETGHQHGELEARKRQYQPSPDGQKGATDGSKAGGKEPDQVLGGPPAERAVRTYDKPASIRTLLFEYRHSGALSNLFEPEPFHAGGSGSRSEDPEQRFTGPGYNKRWILIEVKHKRNVLDNATPACAPTSLCYEA